MKKIFAILLIGIFVLTSGCAPTAAPSDSPNTEPDSSAGESRPGNDDVAQRRPSGASGQNRVIGRIVAVSESEITLEMAIMSQPEGAPSRGDSQPDKERPSDDSMPQSGLPDGGGPGGMRSGGGAFNRDIELEYTGEQASYAISDSVAVTKGMGGGSEALSITDLAEGDVVQLIFDEALQLASIQVLDLGENGD